MNSVNTQNNVPIKIWSDSIETGALEQACNLANLPFVHKHIALMPDVHQGYGMPIGGVMATNGVVVPNAVGKDIGCGMLAMKTNLNLGDVDRELMEKIVHEIKRRIPVGMRHHKKPKHKDLLETIEHHRMHELPVVCDQYEKLAFQLGTLGGGNHFIEIQKGSDGFIWFMIHSGSRNLGSRVADHYDKIAKDLNSKWHSSVPKEHQLAFLPLSTIEGKRYMAEMRFCVDFALANRKAMMQEIMGAFKQFLPDVGFSFPINIAHNYAAMEHHFGSNVVVHRKGATKATINEVGIIPGSQGTKSYIVKGLGNPESFMSCSHGAGRVLDRKAAQRELDLEKEQKILDDQGIIHSVKNRKNLEEAAGAYKPIDVVMKNQEDLVSILTELQPLAVIKG